ncbi:MAG TPA: hypothetical protein VF763_02525 [Candidatus Limnocylindrales bacterium]
MTLGVVLIVALAQAADAVTFAWGVRIVGIDAEMNPLTRAVFSAEGLGPAIILKIAFAVTLCALLAMLRGAPRWHGRLAAGIAGGLGIAGAVGNVLATFPHVVR